MADQDVDSVGGGFRAADCSARDFPRAEAFYLHHGFTRLPVETPTLALDLVKLSKSRDRAAP